MKSPVVKRSIVIASHKTSVSLEDAFWKGLKDIASDRDITLSDLVATIDTERRHGNLSSAIRLFVLDHYRAQDNAADAKSPIPRHDRDARSRQFCAPIDRAAERQLTGAEQIERPSGAAAARLGRFRWRGVAPGAASARGFGAGSTLIAGGSGGADCRSRRWHRTGRRNGGADGSRRAASARAVRPAFASAARCASLGVASRCLLHRIDLLRLLLDRAQRQPARQRVGVDRCASAPPSAPSARSRCVGAHAAVPAAGIPVSVSIASSVASARSTLAAAARSAPLARVDDIAQARLPGSDGDRGLGARRRQLPLSSAVVTKSRMRLASVGMPRSTARITASNTRGLRPAICAFSSVIVPCAGERADERRRA